LLEFSDLRREMQIVIRDSGQYQVADHGWLESEHRWTVSSIERALSTVNYGLGFAWLPRHRILAYLESGELKALPLSQGQTYSAHLYLSYAHPERIGPATRFSAGSCRVYKLILSLSIGTMRLRAGWQIYSRPRFFKP